MRNVMTALLLAALLAACGGEEEAPEPEPAPVETQPAPAAEEPAGDISDPATAAYAPELDVDIAAMERTDTGLYYQIVREGSGATIAPGQTAVVEYTGWLPDGTQFDSSRGREPFAFPLGAAQVITGWDQGVAGMAVGEQRLLVIPPALGYGSMGSGGVIPSDATLVFEVELLEIQ